MSRITLQVNVEDIVLEQIIKQLNKLIEVLKIVELEEVRSVASWYWSRSRQQPRPAAS